MDAEFNRQIRWGQRCTFPGNHPIPLTDPNQIWLVQAGEVAVFRVAVAMGAIAGSRRYLFSCLPDEAIFTVQPTDQESQLLAVSLEPVELLSVHRDDLAAWLAIAQPDAHSWLITWRQKCQKFIDRTWVDTGNPWESDNGDRPDATQLSRPDDFTLEGLEQANQHFLHYLDAFEQQAHRLEWEQFQLQEQFSRQVADDAIAALSGVLNPAAPLAPSPPLAAPNPNDQAELASLLRAIQAVAQAAGVNLRPIKLDAIARTSNPLQAIVGAARVRMRRVLLTDRWWRKDCGALLAYTRLENRPVALIPTAPGRYDLFDPQDYTRTPITATTRTRLSPVAYMFYRSLPDRVIDAWDVLKFSLRGTAKDWWIVLWTGMGITLLSMLLPQGIAILIDEVVPDSDRGLLVQLGCGLLATVVGALIFQLAQGTALIRIETLTESSTQAAFWDRLLSLPVPFFRQYAIGDLRERVSIISTIRSQVSGVVLRTLFTSGFALLNLGLLIYYGGSLAWVAVGVAVMMGIVTIAYGKLILRQLTPLQELEGKLFGLMVQLIQGVAKLRVSGAESRTFAHWGNQYQRQQQLKLTLQQLEDNLLVFNQLLPIISVTIIFGFAAETSPFHLTDRLSTGTFLAFNAAFGSFIVGVTELSNTLISILMVIVLWKRARPILEATPEVDAAKTDPGQLSGRLCLDHVMFHYRVDGPAILHDVTIAVEPGEFVAIVGPSGSGKSTLFRLLLGFEQPQAGQVYYDGQDLRSLDIHAVRRQLGVLLQNSRTSAASIFDNIAGNALITMDEAWEAAHYAGLAEDIEAMPMGMHTVVSDGGSNLSGGQRQRLLIARSLALKPRILLFDEATSSLDNRTQAIVSESLDRLKITRIVIAHRLSTIQTADRIYVLQAGRIVQQGRFEDLMSQDGLFLQLMQQQIA